VYRQYLRVPSKAVARRILLNGTHGVGKRSIGSLLELGYGFRAISVDDSPPPDAKSGFLLDLFEATRRDEDVVIVWSGTCPAEWVELLDGLGFEWFWLDADRGAARPAGVERPGFGPPIPPPRTVDPFSFACLDRLVATLLEPVASAAESLARTNPGASPRAPAGWAHDARLAQTSFRL
jgi:hypothetical protein